MEVNASKIKYLPGPHPGTVKTPSGTVLPVPNGWELLLPGDAALTRRVKSSGEYWQVEEKKGRRNFSKGIYAPSKTIREVHAQLEQERSHPSFAKRRDADQRRREKKQESYVEEFEAAVLAFLQFHALHSDLAHKLAKAVTEHATPVGSGTVARTSRIPLEQRAESVVIAWMRHNTTSYDNLKIPRGKGERRQVRRQLAEKSRQVLDVYRQGGQPPLNCPLQRAVIITK